MKIQARAIESFVRKPDPAARVILLYGPDHGLMRERAQAIGLSVVSDLNDPFNAANLSAEQLADDPARLSDEAGAISMMGGDRLIRIENAGDKLTPLLKAYLENPSAQALVVLEAGELGPRSSLRKLCEQAKNAAALPCYVEDERDLGRIIRETLQQEGLSAAPDAVAFLAAAIGGDRRKVRSELEKFVLYKGGDKSPVTLAEARECCGGAGLQSLDDLVYGLAGSRPAEALKAYDHLLEEGVPVIMILRAVQNHIRRLHNTKTHLQEGEPLDKAMNRLMPRVFFKQEAAFKAQVQKWTLPGLSTALQKLMSLEADCKKTGAPAETLCAQAILALSKSAP